MNGQNKFHGQFHVPTNKYKMVDTEMATLMCSHCNVGTKEITSTAFRCNDAKLLVRNDNRYSVNDAVSSYI